MKSNVGNQTFAWVQLHIAQKLQYFQTKHGRNICTEKALRGLPVRKRKGGDPRTQTFVSSISIFVAFCCFSISALVAVCCFSISACERRALFQTAATSTPLQDAFRRLSDFPQGKEDQWMVASDACVTASTGGIRASKEKISTQRMKANVSENSLLLFRVRESAAFFDSVCDKGHSPPHPENESLTYDIGP